MHLDKDVESLPLSDQGHPKIGSLAPAIWVAVSRLIGYGTSDTEYPGFPVRKVQWEDVRREIGEVAD